MTGTPSDHSVEVLLVSLEKTKMKTNKKDSSCQLTTEVKTLDHS